METYIDRIKLMKNRKKLTNERLSELSGVPLGTLSKLLAGMNESPKLSNIVAICSALDCSVEYIVTGAPDNFSGGTVSSTGQLGKIRCGGCHRKGAGARSRNGNRAGRCARTCKGSAPADSATFRRPLRRRTTDERKALHPPV